MFYYFTHRITINQFIYDVWLQFEYLMNNACKINAYKIRYILTRLDFILFWIKDFDHQQSHTITQKNKKRNKEQRKRIVRFLSYATTRRIISVRTDYYFSLLFDLNFFRFLMLFFFSGSELWVLFILFIFVVDR